jgi:hypothetical protein
MALRCIQVLVLFLIVVLVDLQTCGMQSVNADENAALIMYPSGTAVSTHTLGGTKELTYDVVAKYPASGVITWISQKLQKDGWEPLPYDSLEPDLSSSHVTGWQHFLDGTKKPILCVHQWLGDWKDAAGDVVTYAFRYTQPKCETSDLTDLEVSAIYSPEAVVQNGRQMFEQFKKEHKAQ